MEVVLSWVLLESAAISGVATFDTLVIDAEGIYALRANMAGGISSVVSGLFQVSGASKLAFDTQPVNTAVNTTIPAVTVRILDENDSLVSIANNEVLIHLNHNSKALNGDLTVNAVGGIVTFNNLSIDEADTGYTFTISSDGLTPAVSDSFNIVNAGPAFQLAFVQQPSDAESTGEVISPAITVQVLDTSGFPVMDTVDITMRINNNPGGGILSGDTTITTVNGIATFADLSIDQPGFGYTLDAVSTGLTLATSDSFDVFTSGVATQLAFGQQPSNTAPDSSIVPAVTVQLLDGFNNLVTSATDSVTIAIGNDPGTSTLSGTTKVAAIAGVATFPGLSLNNLGDNYTLEATANGMAMAISDSFDIAAPSNAAKLEFFQQPTNAFVNDSISPSIVVRILDNNDVLVDTATNAVTLSIDEDLDRPVNLGGTLTRNAVGGIATFDDISLDTTGAGYTLQATSGGLTSVTSAAFNTFSAADHLSFVQQPISATAGDTLSPSITVEFLDASNNRVTSANGNVTLALADNPGSGILLGTLTATAVNGVATFDDISMETAAEGYTLVASAAGVSADTSIAFNISPGSYMGAPPQSVFNPINTVAGMVMDTIVYHLLDSYGNLATGSTDRLRIVLSGVAASNGAVLLGTDTVAADGGVVRFTDLVINKADSGYFFVAYPVDFGVGLSSNPFHIFPGDAHHLTFTSQPVSTSPGSVMNPPIEVQVVDSLENLVNDFTGTVVLDFGINPGGRGVLSGTTSIDSSEVATFSDISIGQAGIGYTLSASAEDLQTTFSDPFNITRATRLSFRTEPALNNYANSLLDQVEVEILDANGALVTEASDTITLSILDNPNSGNLSGGSTTIVASSGVATFSSLMIDSVGNGYTLEATTTGLTSDTTNAFNIIPAADSATHLSFLVQPSNTNAGIDMSPDIQVQLLDSANNLVLLDGHDITLTIANNPGTGTLSGTDSTDAGGDDGDIITQDSVTVTTVDGVATFRNISIDSVGVGYTLLAQSADLSLTQVVSDSFDILFDSSPPLVATSLAFVQQPSNRAPGIDFDPHVSVQVLDQFDNPIGFFIDSVTLSIGSNPNSGHLSGDTVDHILVGGLAVFEGVSIDSIGSGYTLMATAPGLNPAVSDSFDISPVGLATQLAFVQQPSHTVSGDTIQPSITVQVLDENGNPANYINPGGVTLTIGSNPSSGSLSGDTVDIILVGGLAVFEGVSIGSIGSGYTLIATAPGLDSAISDPFDILASPTDLAFVQQPTAVDVGDTISPAVTVEALDALGNRIISYNGTIMLELAYPVGTNGSGTLMGALEVEAVAGLATFDTLVVDALGVYALRASASGAGGGITSDLFQVSGATKLAFDSQPVHTPVNATMPPITVRILDENDSLVSIANNQVSIALNVSSILNGTTTVTANGGTATFDDLNISAADTGYTFTVTSIGLASDVSDSFNIVNTGPATQLVFLQQPSNSIVGTEGISPAVTVQVLDANGFLVPDTVDITISINNNPGSGTLSGDTVVTTVGGIATFTDLSIDQPGVGYTFDATATGLATATSDSFDIIAPAIPAQLVFGQQPSNTALDSTIRPAITVYILDAFGNLIDNATNSISMVINNDPSSGATLFGQTGVPAVDGIATFDNLFIDEVGSSFTLDARLDGVDTITSNPFDILIPGTAAKLGFFQQPTNTIAGDTISPPVTVRILDSNDILVSTATDTITLSIDNDLGRPVDLNGTVELAAVNGIATFDDISIDSTGAGYTLRASADGLDSAISNTFDITSEVDHLEFLQEPSDAVAGSTFAPAITVQLLDVHNNLVNTDDSVTLQLGVNPGSGSLLGTQTVAASAGIATFSNLQINEAGSGYALVASAMGATSDTSVAFNINPAAADHLDFTVDPVTVLAGDTIPAVEVSILDAFNNVVTGANDSVTITLGNNPGNTSILGTLVIPAVNGVAVFDDLWMRKINLGYTLEASAMSFAPDTSASFDVFAGTPYSIIYNVGDQPGNTIAGESISMVRFRVLDRFNNGINNATDSVRVSIASNPGGGTLSGTTAAVPNDGGFAAFTNLSIDRAGTGYTLIGTYDMPLLTSDTSVTFDITAASADHLAFSIQPTNTRTDSVMSTVEVQALDAFDNLADYNDTIRINIDNNPGSGALSGTNAILASGGVAAFTDLSIDSAGAGYTLIASSDSGPTSVISDSFNIGAIATQLSFSVEPSDALAGDTLSPSIRVRFLDAGNNLDTMSNGQVTLSIVSDPGGGTLSGTLMVSAINGEAIFDDISIDKSGVGYTLQAMATGVTPDTSTAFTISPASADHLSFSIEPVNTVAGDTVSTVQVSVLDAFDNVVTGSTSSVDLTLIDGPVGSVLLGTVPVSAVSGVAGFSDLRIEQAGAYRLVSSASGLASDTSAVFTISPAAADHLSFSIEPVNTVAGDTVSTVQVSILDAFDNVVTGSTSSVGLTLIDGPVGSVLLGTVPVSAVNGVAGFSDLRIEQAGDYRLVSSASGLTSDTSAVFTISPAVADHLVFSVQPVNTEVDSVMDRIELQALDAYNNLSVYNDTVRISIGTNPGGGILSGDTAVLASGGIAAFTTLSINSPGAGYTLLASADGLTGTEESNSFEIGAGVATRVSFSVEPTDGVAGDTLSPSVVVAFLDGSGDPVSTTDSVTLALGTNPGGGVLQGTLTVAAVGGVATFNDLRLDEAGAGYTLIATASGVTSDTSVAFTISPAAAGHLSFSIEPVNTVAGDTVSTVQVSVLDAFDNVVTGSTSSVGLTLIDGPVGSVLLGTVPVSAVNGVAGFSDLRIEQAGAYRLVSSASGLASDTSAVFTISPAAADHLSFNIEPVNTVAGDTVSTVQVSVLDAFDNVVTGSTSSVGLTLIDGPVGSVLLGTVPVSAVNGVAGFDDLSIQQAGDYRLVSSASGLTSDTSAVFTINPAAADHLVFSIQPSNTETDSVMSRVELQALDAYNNLSVYNDTVRISIGTNPGGGILSGDTAVLASGGIAAFTTLSINSPGAGYTLLASGDGLTGTEESNSFEIGAGAATRVSFSVEPTDGVAGDTLSPSVVVAFLDGSGDPVSTTDSVTLALGTNPGGGVLQGTLTVAAVGGVATFNDLRLDEAGAGYTLIATASGVTSDTSVAFTISPAAAGHLSFSIEPVNTVAGDTVSTVQVSVLDAFDNVVTGSTSSVGLTLIDGPVGSVLLGTVPVSAVNGVAGFSDLRIEQAGTYRLLASASGLTSDTSVAFTISPAAADHLVFAVQPTNTDPGVVISPSIEVQVFDAFNNLLTNSSDTVRMSINNDPGSGTLSGDAALALTAGSAIFSNLSINNAGDGYTLLAEFMGIQEESDPFNIAVGSPVKLSYSIQPSNTVAGVAIDTIEVQILDNSDNLVASANNTVTIAMDNNAGGGTLSGSLSVNAVAGIARFTDVSIDRIGVGYTLRVSATGLSDTVSSAFDITAGEAAQLAFNVDPTTTVAGEFITPSIVVEVQDTLDNLVAGDTSEINLLIANNPGDGTLSGVGSISLNAVNGRATFSNAFINEAGVGYTLVAVADSLTSAFSAAFDITPAAADHLVFDVQPTNTNPGVVITPAIEVEVLDEFDNLVVGDTSTIRMSIANNPGGSMLSGDTAVVVSGGTAVFSNLSIPDVGIGYTLRADATDLVGVVSDSFDIGVGVATQMVISVQPSNTAAGEVMNPAMEVRLLDFNDSLVTSTSVDITASIGNNPGGGSLTGTTTVTTVNGVAVFDNLIIDNIGTGYTLVLDAAGLSPVTSDSFDITHGSVDHLVFSTQPTNTVAGLSINPSVVVRLEDANNNLVTNSSDTVFLAIADNPGGGVLSGTLNAISVGGEATFTGISIDRVGVGYTLRASVGSVQATSDSFNILPGVADHLVFATQPTDIVAGDALPDITVSVRDVNGNVATGANGTITLSIDNNPGMGTLSGVTSEGVVSGQATFTGISIGAIGENYTLQAALSGVPVVVSDSFDVTTSGVAYRLQFVSQPVNTQLGDLLNTITVEVMDSLGNPVPDAANEVSIGINDNPGGAALSGTTSVTAVNGEAVFTDLALDSSAVGYTLIASASGLLPDISDTFNITGEPILRLGTDSLVFDSTAVGISDIMTFEVFNDGNVPLVVTAVNYPDGFSGNWSGGAIAPGSSQVAVLTFRPTEARSYLDVLGIVTNAGNGNIILSGLGVELVTGIEDELVPEDIIAYPNPATNEINLVFKDRNGVRIDEVQIYGSTGTKMAVEKDLSIDNNILTINLRNFINGVYTVVVDGVTKKFIVKR